MTEVDLTFIAHQIERVLRELASTRDQLRLQSVILARLDNSRIRDQGALIDILREMHAIHEQTAHMNDRIRKLEDAGVKS